MNIYFVRPKLTLGSHESFCAYEGINEICFVIRTSILWLQKMVGGVYYYIEGNICGVENKSVVTTSVLGIP